MSIKAMETLPVPAQRESKAIEAQPEHGEPTLRKLSSDEKKLKREEKLAKREAKAARERAETKPRIAPALKADAESEIQNSDDGSSRSQAEKKRIKLERRAAKERKKAAEAVKSATDTNDVDSPLPKNTSVIPASNGPSSLESEQHKQYMLEKNIRITDTADTTVSDTGPFINFSDLPSMRDYEKTMFKSFKEPSPIQAAAWPYLLQHRDVIGIAETGSGKTLAFGVPCMRHVKRALKEKPHEKNSIKAVIMSPTRELALQSFGELQKLNPEVKVVCVYGGTAREDQARQLKGAQIIVATPGRLIDFCNSGDADLSKADYVVLDEADRMLDTGFEPDIRKIMGFAPAARQTLMFTATWPQEIRMLAEKFMKDPVRINVGEPSGELRANVNVGQEIVVMQSGGHDERREKLFDVLGGIQRDAKRKNDKIIIFCLYKKEAPILVRQVRGLRFKVGELHGDMNQAQRTTNLDQFRNGEVTVIVATDVMSRGIDVMDVKLVLNYSFPLTIDDYVHRIGRTGRAGAKGHSITFFTMQDKKLAGSLVNVLKEAKQPVPTGLLKFGTTVKRKEHELYGSYARDADFSATAKKIKFD